MLLATGQLPLADHVHRLDAGNQDARAARSLESQHRSHNTLDAPVLLLNDVVNLFGLAQLDGGSVRCVVPDNRRGVRTALVDGDLLGLAV